MAQLNRQQKHHHHQQHWRTYDVDSVWCKNVIWYTLWLRRDYNIIVYIANIISFDWRLSIYFCLVFRSVSVFFFAVCPFYTFVCSDKCHYVTLVYMPWKNSHFQWIKKTARFRRSEKSKLVLYCTLNSLGICVWKQIYKQNYCVPKVLLVVQHFFLLHKNSFSLSISPIIALYYLNTNLNTFNDSSNGIHAIANFELRFIFVFLTRKKNPAWCN